MSRNALHGRFGVLFVVFFAVSATLMARALQYRSDGGDGGSHMVFTLNSPRFADGQVLPSAYTCDGTDSSPGLYWSEPPKGTQSLALVVEDPDAPGKVWSHWIVYDLPPALRGMDDNTPRSERLPNGAAQGRNDFGKIGYGGPCPPSGSHRYVFTLYALDRPLGLPPGLTKDQLVAALGSHILGQARITCTYSRR